MGDKKDQIVARKPQTLLEQRLCFLCNMGNVEDEVHVLLVYPFNKKERYNPMKVCNLDMIMFYTYIDKLK